MHSVNGGASATPLAGRGRNDSGMGDCTATLLSQAMLTGSSTHQLEPGHGLPSSALCHEELGNESEERVKENGRGSQNQEWNDEGIKMTQRQNEKPRDKFMLAQPRACRMAEVPNGQSDPVEKRQLFCLAKDQSGNSLEPTRERSTIEAIQEVREKEQSTNYTEFPWYILGRTFQGEGE